MTRTNVRLEDTGIVHAHARSNQQIARCGVEYIRDGQKRFMLDNRCVGSDTEDPVDCMTCLVRSEWENADIREIIAANSVKDIQEGEDMRYVDALTWQGHKGGGIVNVQIIATTHRKAPGKRRETRCGLRFIRPRWPGDLDGIDGFNRPIGRRTKTDVDCMSCLVRIERSFR